MLTLAGDFLLSSVYRRINAQKTQRNNIIMLQFLGKMIQDWYNTFGYGGVVLAMALESCLIPLPSEIVMPLAGAMTLAAFGASVKFSLFGVALAGAVGSVIGSVVAYWIGATGGRAFIFRYGKYILISRHDFDIADRWFLRHGSPITFFSRVLPVVRTYISLPAGIAKMNIWRFMLFTFLGSFIWSYALAYVGQKLGQNYDKLSSYFHGLDAFIVAAFVILVVLYVWRHFRNEKKYSEMHDNPDMQPTSKMPRIR